MTTATQTAPTRRRFAVRCSNCQMMIAAGTLVVGLPGTERHASECQTRAPLPAPTVRPVPQPAPVVVTQRRVVSTSPFRCPRCGSHRDTTLRGVCDDCGN